MILRRTQQKSQFLPAVATAQVLLRSNVLLVTIETNSTRCCCSCGRFPLHPSPAEMVAQVLKRAGKWTWLPERVVWVVGGGGSVASGVMVGVALTAGLQTVFLKSASLPTLSVDTMTGLPRTRSCSVFSFRDTTGRGRCKGVPEPGALCAVVEVHVHGCTWTGVACCRNWSEARDTCWRNCVTRCASSTGCAVVFIPRRARESASVQCWFT
jgi:hypothetical protein